MKLFPKKAAEAANAAKELLLSGEESKKLKGVTVVRTKSDVYQKMMAENYIPLQAFEVEDTSFTIFAT